MVGSEVLRTEPQNLIDPKDIKTFLKHEQDCVELPKFPLNPNETIELKVLYTGYAVKFQTRGRIADGNVVETNSYDEYLKRSRKTKIRQAALFTVFSMLVIGGISLLLSPIFEKLAQSPQLTLSPIFVTIGIPILSIMMFAYFYLFLTLPARIRAKKKGQGLGFRLIQ